MATKTTLPPIRNKATTKLFEGLQVVNLLIDKLVHPSYNPRKISDNDFDHLKRSLKEFGAVDPAIVNMHEGREYILVGGNQRVRAAQSLGWKEFPCVLVDLNEKREKELNIRLNRNTGEWDYDLLKEGFTADQLFDLGFNDLDGLDDLFAAPATTTKQSKVKADEKFFTDAAADLGGAVDLKADMYFESNEIYGIPPLRKDMLSDIPEPITTYIGPHETEECEHYIWIWHKDVVRRDLDFHKVIVGFYTQDHIFEGVWNDAPSTTKKVLLREPYACVMPNFSLWRNTALALQIWNTYRSKWIARYWQEAGIKIIPDINFALPGTMDFTLAGIPKNPPAVSIQLQNTAQDIFEANIVKQSFQRMLQEIKPQSILVYCTPERLEKTFIPLCPKSLHYVFCESRLSKRIKFTEGTSKKSLKKMSLKQAASTSERE